MTAIPAHLTSTTTTTWTCKRCWSRLTPGTYPGDPDRAAQVLAAWCRYHAHDDTGEPT